MKKRKLGNWKIAISDSFVTHEYEFKIDPSNCISDVVTVIDLALRFAGKGNLKGKRSINHWLIEAELPRRKERKK